MTWQEDAGVVRALSLFALASADPLDVWAIIDGNMARQATPQEIELRDALLVSQAEIARLTAALEAERKARKAVESVNAEEVLRRRTNLEAQIEYLTAALEECGKDGSEETDNWSAAEQRVNEWVLRAEASEQRVAKLEAALRESRTLAIQVADKNIGRLSDEARVVQGRCNAVLADLPSFEDVGAALGEGEK